MRKWESITAAFSIMYKHVKLRARQDIDHYSNLHKSKVECKHILLQKFCQKVSLASWEGLNTGNGSYWKGY